ncbi:hypothetical protein ANO11243_022980 [Dothideomycetidae sp. 11243]|nr:hypothetical protein ANO11243_022980 [fungal sp. No.11243]
MARLPLPPVSLPTTSSTSITLSALPPLTIIFIYPRTGAPNESITAEWDAIPGARGCTPQACGFRDVHSDLIAAGAGRVFGLSVQTSEYQAEVKRRLGLPFELLSDERLEFADALGLPTFDWEGGRLIKRVTLAVREGRIVKVWYPVFPPDRSAAEVLEWLKAGADGK